MTFGILNKEWSKFKATVIYCLVAVNIDIGICLNPHFLKNVNNFETPKTDFSLASANNPQSFLDLYLQV